MHARGYTGAGISVAVLDTGIDTDHPDLADDLVVEQCFCNDVPNPNRGCCPNGRPSQSGPGAAEDVDGHGTSVSGIVTSANAAATGVAPGAGIVAIQVFDPATGSVAFSDAAAALEWVLDNRTAYDIRVVNLSFSDGREYDDSSASPCSNTNTANAIGALHDVGVVTFASSGNQAHVAGIAFPACVGQAMAVGGVYDAALGATSWCSPSGCDSILCTDNPTAADVFVCHSNSGSLLDALAPNWRTRTTGPGGGLVNFGGTSASSPYAAAQAALLLQADPTLNPESLRSLLTAHATPVTNPANGLVHPRSDVGLALSAITQPNGTPVPALAPAGRALLALLLVTSAAAVGGAPRPLRRRGATECP